MTLKVDANFKGKLTCGLKNNMRNLVNFHARKCEDDLEHYILYDL